MQSRKKSVNRKGMDEEMSEKVTHRIAVLADTHGLLRPEVKIKDG